MASVEYELSRYARSRLVLPHLAPPQAGREGSVMEKQGKAGDQHIGFHGISYYDKSGVVYQPWPRYLDGSNACVCGRDSLFTALFEHKHAGDVLRITRSTVLLTASLFLTKVLWSPRSFGQNQRRLLPSLTFQNWRKGCAERLVDKESLTIIGLGVGAFQD